MHTFEQAQAMRYYRQRFSEMPVGDAMSGAAYGEYLKSKAVGAIIGVVAAVAAVWTGGATLAAYAAGTAGVSTAAAISAGAMVAGGVMSGVGAVTGNKKLMKVGGVLSLAGGLGAMAFGTSSSAGLLSSTEGATAAPVGGEIAGSSTNNQAQLFNTMGESATATQAPAASGMADASLQVASEAPAISNAPGGLADQFSGAAQNSSTAGNIVDESVANAAMDAAAKVPTPPPVSGGGGGGLLNQAGDAITGVGKFAKDNKELIEIGGKMMMGAMDPENELTGAKEALYKAQTTATEATARNTDTVTEAQKQKMATEEQQRKNANTQILMLDPRDPQYAQKKAEATAKGIPTMDMVTPASERVTMANQDYTKTANQWVPNRPGILNQA